VKHWSEETNWQRLSDVVQALKARVEKAIVDRDDFDGEAAHNDLTSAEWRLCQAERRRDRG
jgi:hypothetical protein